MNQISGRGAGQSWVEIETCTAPTPMKLWVGCGRTCGSKSSPVHAPPGRVTRRIGYPLGFGFTG